MTRIFQHKTETYVTASNKIHPLILKVTTTPTDKGVRVVIKGKKNPFPFKEAIIPTFVCDLTSWLEKFGYQRIAEFDE